MKTQKSIEFTRLDSDKISELEKQIVYLYGVKNPELVVEHYLQAIQILEKEGISAGKSVLGEKMMPFLDGAYLEIKRQTSYQFDIKKAASIEFDLIFAQSIRAPFEEIYNIMVDLYREVFQSTEKGIEKAAMLRTFLYQYKIMLLSLDPELSEEDIGLMIRIAKRSEEELNQLA